ncbi:MgtC/SapB family protein [Pseudomonadota bacterium]
MEIFYQIGLALALGLLIGIERGWSDRKNGIDITAGIRTFGLIGLSGALTALIAQELGPIILAAGIIALTILLVASHIVEARFDHDPGITTVTAGLVTFLLGVLPVYGYYSLAAAGAVLTSVLLSLKPILHGWIERLTPDDWYATLKLLLISVVLIPLLPDKQYGPWNALNPYELWWLVVMIGGISFLGYVAMKMIGSQKGLLLTGVLGGLASSTATTLSLAKLYRNGASLNGASAGILISSTMMFPRVLFVVWVLNSQLGEKLVLPVITMSLITLVGGLITWHRESRLENSEITLSNPFRLLPAIQFGLILAGVMLVTAAGRHWLGDHGLYIVSFIASLADVDAVVLSVARLSDAEINLAVAGNVAVLAMIGNTASKAALAVIVGGVNLAKKLLPWFCLAMLAGGLSIYGY